MNIETNGAQRRPRLSLFSGEAKSAAPAPERSARNRPDPELRRMVAAMIG